MKPIIIYPQTVDWDYLHQRPQQMLKALAKLGYTCIFGNTNMEKKRMRGLEMLNQNLYLGNEMSLGEMISWCRKHWPKQKIIVLYSYPGHVAQVMSSGADYVIFDSLDEPELEFSHWKPQYASAVTSANLVIASAQSLQVRAQALRQDEVILVPNGCDYDHFKGASVAKEVNEPPFNWIPQEQPIIGFVGAVASWLDWDLISLAARKMPDYHFVFIGSFHGITHPPIVGPNIHYVGHKDYKDLPKYMSHCEYLWIPFKLNEMTRGVNPIKMWEYLATGIPVISTALPEVPADYVDIVDSDFKTVSSAKYHHHSDKQKYAKLNSWGNRAQRLHRLLVQKGWAHVDC